MPRMFAHSGPAHPRAGGENWVLIEAFAISVGSSPRGRGKQTVRILSISGDRLIPARAGKTSGTVCGWRGPSAHPRAGGENHGVQSRIVNQTGSSPRGRGKPANPIFLVIAARLIPARAGKTRNRVCCPEFEWAHPRAGGENGFSLPVMFVQ